ncbi:PH domain protein [Ichthyophthirius multifiliis]|uniref:PH domain protein n=1 Tax=Ichthyophthirius multifiliis TaxID=5932 RepID=G0R5M4_ICHMU|nr:PH domain protein [Ichthyophthirius multifiliis]EGR27232.1 PH domain protein [Ichthyophthirius multifiliis]|eukprot:XP_004024116.1 PH domain protein [Ichthyophthirius multifiliis]
MLKSEIIRQIYIKNSLILEKKEKELEEIQPFQFCIKNRYEKVVFAFENEQEMKNWLQKISQKIEQYATLEELLKIQEKKEEKQQQYTKNTTFDQKNKPFLKITAFMENFSFKFKKTKSLQENPFHFQLFLNNFNYKKSLFQFQNESFLEFQSFQIIDGVHKFQNEIFQQFLLIEKGSLYLNRLKKNKEISKAHFEVFFKCENLNLNWKPDTYIEIIKFIYQKIKKQKFLIQQFQEKEDEKDTFLQKILKKAQEENKEKKISFQNSQKTVLDKKCIFQDFQNAQKSSRCSQLLTKMVFSIQNLDILCFHRTSNQQVFKINGNSLQNTVYKTSEALFIDGKILDISIYDQTGYPKNEKPYILIGKQKDQQQQDNNICIYKWSTYKDQNIYNKDQITSFLYLEFNNIEALYQNQPILRIINYITYYLIFIFIQPQSIVMNDDFLQQRILNRQKAKVKQVYGNKLDLLKQLLFPTFIDFGIFLNNTILKIKPFAYFREYFQLNISKIDILNENIISNKRFTQDFSHLFDLYEENWLINCYQLTIEYIKEDEKINTLINSSFKINSLLYPLKLKLLRKQYVHIIRMCIHNFTYGDQKDHLYYHNYDIQDYIKPTQLVFLLDFPKVDLYPVLNEEPQCKLMLQNMRLEWIKNTDSTISIGLWAQKIKLCAFEKFNDSIIEKIILGENINEIQTREEIKVLNNIQQENDIYIKYTFDNHFEKTDSQFLYWQTIDINGDKNMHLEFQKIKIFLKLDIIWEIVQWQFLEDDCWPKYEEFFEICRIVFVLKIKQSHIIFPNQSFKYTLVSKGDLQFIHMRQRTLQIDDFKQKIKQNIIDNQYLADLGDFFSQQIILKSFEIFTCDQLFLDKKKFNLILKKSLLLPTDFSFKISKELQFQIPSLEVFYNTKYNFSLDKTALKISYKDIVLLQKTYKFQTELMKDFPSNTTNDTPLKLPEQSIFDIVLHGVHIYIIDDLQVPVFELFIDNSQFVKNNILTKSILSTIIRFQVNFYNPVTGKWEPIIEHTGLDLDLSLNNFANPHKYCILELNPTCESININLCKELFSILKYTQNSWKNEQYILEKIEDKRNLKRKQTQVLENIEENNENQNEQNQFNQKKNKGRVSTRIFNIKDSQENQQEDYLEYVSPYTIRNELGYMIEIESDFPDFRGFLRKYNVPNEEEVNFQVENEYESMFFIRNTSHYDKKTFSVFILHPQCKFQSLKGIDLDAIDKKIVIIYDSQNNNNSLYKYDQQLQIVVEVMPQEARKIIILRSSIFLVNKLDTSLYIKLQQEQEKSVFQYKQKQILKQELKLLQPSQKYYIPFDKIQFCLQFKFANNTSIQKDEKVENNNQTLQYNKSWSQYIFLKDLQNNINQIEYQEINHSFDKITIIKIEKELKLQGIDLFTISLEPTVIIKNRLPFKFDYKIFIEQIGNNNCQNQVEGTLNNQQEIQLHNINSKNLVYIQVQIQGFKLSQKQILQNFGIYQQNWLQKIQIEDYENRIQFLEIQIQEESFAIRKYFIYTSQFAINDTPYSIYYFYKQKKNVKLLFIYLITFLSKDNTNFCLKKNQKICLLSNQQNLLISLNKNGKNLSKQIDLQGIGNYKMELKFNNSTQIYEFGINTSLICVDFIRQIYTKVVLISPRYILVNNVKIQNINNYINKKTLNELSVCQSTCQKQTQIYIVQNSRVPFYWTDGQKERKIIIKCTDKDNQIWGWSGGISINDIDIISFSLRNQITPNQLKYMKLEIREDGHLIYLVISECQNNEEAVYLIDNKLQNVCIEVYQKNFNNQKLIINEKSEQQFAWEVPVKEKDIVVDLIFLNQLQNQYAINTIYINLDENDVEREYQVKSIQNEECFYRFYIMICFEGSTKKIKFYCEEEIKQRNKLEEDLDIQFGINISNIKFSILNWNKNKRQELALITLKNTEVVILQTYALRACQVKIGFIQIDNNISNQALFPVIFTPSAYAFFKPFANPLGLAKSLYIGFSDLLNYPLEGFVKGPIEGTIGLTKGAFSLLKNTISGSLNSMQSLTEPLCTVLAYLSLDDTFMQKREYIKSLHPSHAFAGIFIGFLAFILGIQRGVQGFFDLPYYEAKKKGSLGFLIGSIKGFSGLIFKPFCGGIDFVQKTAEGIVNTITVFDDKPSNKRIRMIRSFYSKNQYFKEYNEQDAKMSLVLGDYMNGKYKNQMYMGSYQKKNIIIGCVNQVQKEIIFGKLKYIKDK